MILLLDSHILIWSATLDSRLSAGARRLIADSSNTVLVSTASLWELAVKQALGKLRINLPALVDALDEHDYSLISVTKEHTLQLLELPQHHRDPFDRMLIAQAVFENARLVTHDASLSPYGDIVLLV